MNGVQVNKIKRLYNNNNNYDNNKKIYSLRKVKKNITGIFFQTNNK